MDKYNLINNRKKFKRHLRKSCVKMSYEIQNIIKVMVNRETDVKALESKHEISEEKCKKLQNNILNLQVQYNELYGLYQDEIKHRHETLKKVAVNRKTCDMLEECVETLMNTFSRCHSDKNILLEGFQEHTKELNIYKDKYKKYQENTGRNILALESKLKFTTDHEQQMFKLINSMKETRTLFKTTQDELLKKINENNKLENMIANCQREAEMVAEAFQSFFSQVSDSTTKSLNSLLQEVESLLKRCIDEYLTNFKFEYMNLEFRNKEKGLLDFKLANLKLTADLEVKESTVNELTKSLEEVKKELLNQATLFRDTNDRNNELKEMLGTIEGQQVTFTNEFNNLKGETANAMELCEILKSTNNQLNAEKDELINNYNNLKGEHANAMELCEILKSTNNQLNAEKDELINNYNNLKVEHANAMELCEILKSTNYQLNAEKDELINNYNNLKGEHVNDMELCEILKSTNNQLNAEKDELVNNYNNLKGEHANAMELCEILKSTNIQLNAEKDELINNYNNLKGDHANALELCEILKSTNYQLNAEKDELKNNYNNLKGEHANAMELCEILKSTNIQLNAEKDELINNYNNLKGDHANALELCEILKSTNYQLNAEKDELINNYNNLKGEHANALELCEIIKSTNNQLNADKDELINNFNDLKGEYAKTMKTIEVLKSSNNQLNADKIELIQILIEKEEIITSNESEIVNLKKECEKAAVIASEFSAGQRQFETSEAHPPETTKQIAEITHEISVKKLEMERTKVAYEKFLNILAKEKEDLIAVLEGKQAIITSLQSEVKQKSDYCDTIRNLETELQREREEAMRSKELLTLQIERLTQEAKEKTLGLHNFSEELNSPVDDLLRSIIIEKPIIDKENLSRNKPLSKELSLKKEEKQNKFFISKNKHSTIKK